MHALTWLATTPTPTPTSTVNPDNVTPGVIGFIGTAVIAIALVFLLIDMLRRIRRAGYRAEIAEELDAEATERAGEGGAGIPDPTGDASSRPGEVTPEDPAKG